MKGLHFLSIIKEQVKLDNFEVLGVKEYRLEHKAGECPAVTLVLWLEDFDLQSKSAGNHCYGNLTEDIKIK